MSHFGSLRILTPVGAAALLTACAAPTSYMDISLTPDAQDAAIQQQARQAMAGYKQAQLGLGMRFEGGDGVARDLAAAKKLYRQAASDSGGTIWVYTPRVGNGTSGRVVPVQSGTKQYGLAEAQRRLGALKW